MELVLNAEQRQIRDAAKRFFSEKVTVKQLRSLRDQRDPIGYSTSTWQEFIALGYAAASVPEAHGGLALGYLAFGSILEEAGRVLFASPLLGTIVGGTSIMELAASAPLREAVIQDCMTGKKTIALALDERSSHSPTDIRTTAVIRDGRYIINGRKSFVLDGGFADQLIIVARTAGDMRSVDGLSLFLVPRATEGVQCESLRMVDSRNAATITLKEVQVDRLSLIGTQGEAWPIIEQVLDRLRVCLAAEMLGGIEEVFDRTIAYLKEREQFGVKIGSFQALKHRAAKMRIEIELTRSAVLDGLAALDARSKDTGVSASLAKARANDTFRLVTNESIQMHGGIGVTDALDLGLYLKRSRVALQTFGDSHFHRDRHASLMGY